MLEEIELVSIERVDSHIKNFDLIIIFRNYTRPVKHIDNIPKASLGMIKEWLNSENILFIEGGSINIKWDKYLKTVVDDPEAFIKDGGWKGFQDEESDEESLSEQEDSEFEEESESSEESYSESDLVDEDDEEGSEEEEEFEGDEYSEEEEEKPKKGGRKK